MGGEFRLKLIKSHLSGNLPPICKMCEYPNMASTVDLSEDIVKIKKIFGVENEGI